MRLVDEDEAAYDALLALGYRAVPVTVVGDRVVSVLSLEIHQGRIAFACAVSIPERLGRLTSAWSKQEHDAPIIESW